MFGRVTTINDREIPQVNPWTARVLKDGPPLFGAAEAVLRSKAWKDAHARNIPYCALLHFRACLLASIQENRQGEHSVAACLLRQCVESLTLIEVGLLEESIGASLVRDWHDGKKSHGELRRALESQIWSCYGTGLWTEPWTEFFANLAKAVQPYAHYSQQLMMWQFHALTKPESKGGAEDSYQFIASVGPMFEDVEKTSQISVLQALVLWTLGRQTLANGSGVSEDTRSSVTDLGAMIRTSGFVVEKVSWSDLLVPVLVGGA